MAESPIAIEIRSNIDAALDRVEQTHNVRILLAVESGSRAWGFPSPDSDYDVRFIYVRPRNAYLSLQPPRDVIEEALGPVIDMNGWDVRKMLNLAIRSNAVVIEWLMSPIRYRAQKSWPDRLLQIAAACCSLPALEYHYDRLARRSLAELQNRSEVEYKPYFYGLRAAMALRWIRTLRTFPPMNINELLAGTAVGQDAGESIAKLVREKSMAPEHARTGRTELVDQLIVDALAVQVGRPTLQDRADEGLAMSDALFLEILRETDADLSRNPS